MIRQLLTSTTSPAISVAAATDATVSAPELIVPVGPKDKFTIYIAEALISVTVATWTLYEAQIVARWYDSANTAIVGVSLPCLPSLSNGMALPTGSGLSIRTSLVRPVELFLSDFVGNKSPTQLGLLAQFVVRNTDAALARTATVSARMIYAQETTT